MGEQILPAEIRTIASNLLEQRAVQQQMAAVTPAKQGVEPFGGLTADGELELGGYRLGGLHRMRHAREQGQQ
ncbi:hypothetical protein D3C81_1353190 [compost metagenome]